MYRCVCATNVISCEPNAQMVNRTRRCRLSTSVHSFFAHANALLAQVERQIEVYLQDHQHSSTHTCRRTYTHLNRSTHTDTHSPLLTDTLTSPSVLLSVLLSLCLLRCLGGKFSLRVINGVKILSFTIRTRISAYYTLFKNNEKCKCKLATIILIIVICFLNQVITLIYIINNSAIFTTI